LLFFEGRSLHLEGGETKVRVNNLDTVLEDLLGVLGLCEKRDYNQF
jgi:hypothetical protein